MGSVEEPPDRRDSEQDEQDKRDYWERQNEHRKQDKDGHP